MERRRLLATAGGLLSATVGGCLGDGADGDRLSIEDAAFWTVDDSETAAGIELDCTDGVTVAGHVPRRGCYDVGAAATRWESSEPNELLLKLTFEPKADGRSAPVCVSTGELLALEIDIVTENVDVEAVDLIYPGPQAHHLGDSLRGRVLTASRTARSGTPTA